MSAKTSASTSATASMSADTRAQRTLVAARAQRARDRRLATRDLILAITTPFLLLVLGELCPRGQSLAPRFFPPATRILTAGGERILSGALWEHTAPTLIGRGVGGGLGALAGNVV